MKKIHLLCLAALLATASTSFLETHAIHAEKIEKYKTSQNAIANRYVVIFRDDIAAGDVGDTTNSLTTEYFGKVDKLYQDAVKGYSVESTPEEARRLSTDPRVKYVEEDSWVTPTEVEYNPYWALDRIDQHALPFNLTYNYNANGTGVNVYVIDSGILTTHVEIAGRAFDAVNTTGDNTPIQQCNGHGTGVAGVVGSTTFGVAKNSRLYSVRVLPCTGNGSLSDVLSGIDWVKHNAVRPAVANISGQTLLSGTFNDAVANSIAAGITYVVAAGNNSDNACNWSPSSVPGAIVVGATNSYDQRVVYSNFGQCVDVFAPGEGVETIWNSSNTTTTGASGTSFASPMVAGVAALYLQTHPTASPAEVQSVIVSNATQGVVSNPGASSPNLLLYSRLPRGGAGGACQGADLSGSGGQDAATLTTPCTATPTM
jgi:subtilisin family serine protease